MNPIRLLITVLIAAGLVAAQDNKSEATVIPIKTLTGDAFDRLHKLLSVFKVSFASDSKLRTVVIYAPKDITAEMRRVIETLDRPGSEAAAGRNIDLSIAFLRASTKPSTEGKASAEAKPLPADLEAVAKQLRAATAYKDVQLWDSMPIRLQEGKRTEQSARLPGAAAPAMATVQMTMWPEAVWTKDNARYVRFDSIKFGFRIPYAVSSGPNTQYQFIDVGINTAGDFKEGQKSVLGKVSGLDDDSAIFVVLSPRILD